MKTYEQFKQNNEESRKYREATPYVTMKENGAEIVMKKGYIHAYNDLTLVSVIANTTPKWEKADIKINIDEADRYLDGTEYEAGSIVETENGEVFEDTITAVVRYPDGEKAYHSIYGNFGDIYKPGHKAALA